MRTVALRKAASNASIARQEKKSNRRPIKRTLSQIKPPGEESDMAADKRALLMLARAAYPFEAYPRFWARIATQGGPADAYVALHPLTQRRGAAMGRVIAEIKAKQTAHKAIQP